MGRVDDPRFRGLLGKSADILKGLRTLFERFEPASAPSGSQGKQSSERQRKQPAPTPSSTKGPHDATHSPKGNSADGGGDRWNAGRSRPTKADGRAPAVSARTSRFSSPPPEGKRATRAKDTAAPSNKSGEGSAQAKPAASNGGEPQPLAVRNAKLADQRKRARAPMMPPKTAPKPMPPHSGKPIWAKPHSS